jgi:glycosyltransferase involved in cell wall biosynthesis
MTSRFPKLAVQLYSHNLKKLYKKAVELYGVPEVMISHFSLPSGFATAKLCNEKNIPFINFEHHSLFAKLKISKYIRENLKLIINQSKAFVCKSTFLKEQLERHSGITNKIVVINQHLDSRFQFVQPNHNDRFIFLSVGNLKPIKQFELLISSFIASFTNSDNVELRIAGDGELYHKLNKIIKTKGREMQIHLLGQLSTDTLIDEYSKCNSFVLLSKVETFGNVFREAMAIGRPVISTRNGGILENWSNGFRQC